MQSISHWGLIDTSGPTISDYETSMAATVADYEEVLSGHRALVRRLDVALNGSGAASQASLCDIVGQVEDINRKTGGEGILT